MTDGATGGAVFEVGSLSTSVPSLEGTTPRQFALTAHQVLRELILKRTIPAGAVLKQAEVARAFEASRTPIREAFRMLQEEGLIAIEPNQRAIVVGFDAADLDAAYASRILLESLAAGLTTSTISEAKLKEGEEALRRMQSLHTRHRTSEEWAYAHADFHRLLVSGGGAELVRQVKRLQERTRPYLRFAQLGEGDEALQAYRMHRAILSAMRRHREADVVRAMASHLAMTAEHVMRQVDPGHGLAAVSAAVRMVVHKKDSAHPPTSPQPVATAHAERPARSFPSKEGAGVAAARS